MNASCPQCGRNFIAQLDSTWLIACTNCKKLVYGDPKITDARCAMPDDWSMIQIGSKVMYQDKLHSVVGRARLQMKSDFLNLWCATYSGKALWIGQSLEKIGFFDSDFSPYPTQKYKEPRAGLSIEFSENTKLKCELVEGCLDIRFEGELARLPFPLANFLFIQANNEQGNTALVFSETKERTEFLWGEIKLAGSVKFENTRQFNEWK